MNGSLSEGCTRREFLKGTFRLACLGGVSVVLPRTLTAMAPQETEPALAETDAVSGTMDTPDAAVPVASGFEPAYLELHRSGELRRRAEALRDIMRSCRLCPRECGVNRLEGEEGFCRTPGATLVVATASPHFGEERPLVGSGGSGTIFFSHCNLRCVFCQNYTIAHFGRGADTPVRGLAGMMMALQRIGCHNINIVTPTHYSPHVVEAVDVAAEKGLRLPIVYNTSGWERMEILRLLEGVVDIYLPDFKYWDPAMSAKYSAGAQSYPRLTKQAILEMHRQVGVAKPAETGIMQRGLMIRHLVMPNGVSGSEHVVEWIAGNLPKDTYVNIMAQYNPVHKAYDYPEISRRITREEYDRVAHKARDLGLTNLDLQWYSWL
jgi:putative pyruvate formate lyase activating enzyme